MKIELDPFSPVMLVVMIWATVTGALAHVVMSLYGSRLMLPDRAVLWICTILCLVLGSRAFFVELSLAYDRASIHYRVQHALTMFRGSFSCFALGALYVFARFDFLESRILWMILAPIAIIDGLDAFRNWSKASNDIAKGKVSREWGD